MLTLWGPLLALIASSLLGPNHVQQRGLGTGYNAWKPEWIWVRGKRIRSSTGKPYCWWGKHVRPGQPIVAHRTLPCGTRIHVKTVGSPNPGAWLTVGDRGPYGACVRYKDLRKLQARGKGKYWRPSKYCRKRNGRGWVWYVKKSRRWPGRWRGLIDISHEARRLIDHDGFEKVIITYERRVPTS